MYTNFSIFCLYVLPFSFLLYTSKQRPCTLYVFKTSRYCILKFLSLAKASMQKPDLAHHRTQGSPGMYVRPPPDMMHKFEQKVPPVGMQAENRLLKECGPSPRPLLSGILPSPQQACRTVPACSNPRMWHPGARANPFRQNEHSASSINVTRLDSEVPGSMVHQLGSGGSHPNDGIDVSAESLLPVHHAFRPGMDSPRVQPVQLSSRMLGKRGMVKEDVIAIVNSEVEDCIKKLSSKGKFVPEYTVKQLAMDIVRQACRGSDIRINWYEVKAANEYSKLHGRTNELIKLYCQLTPITTLHDLGLAIAHIENTSEYENLCMGPLVKHPIVKDLFKPPDDLATPPKITLFQLYQHVMKMTARRRMNTSGERFSLEDYLEFVRKKEGLESTFHLCIRIKSFPLLLQVYNIIGI